MVTVLLIHPISFSLRTRMYGHTVPLNSSLLWRIPISTPSLILPITILSAPIRVNAIVPLEIVCAMMVTMVWLVKELRALAILLHAQAMECARPSLNWLPLLVAMCTLFGIKIRPWVASVMLVTTALIAH